MERVKRIEDLTEGLLIENIGHQARQGVDYMTIHAGVRLEHLPLCQHRVTGIVSRGGGVLARWMVHHMRENPLYERFDDILEGCRRHDVSISLADDYFKTAEFCSMCGPKYCPMHNFKDVDWDAVRDAVARRKSERAGAIAV